MRNLGGELLWIFIFIQCGFSGNYEGDVCKTVDEVVWKCKNINDCPSAKEMIKNKLRPETCRYEDLDVIVCCDPSPFEDYDYNYNNYNYNYYEKYSTDSIAPTTTGYNKTTAITTAAYINKVTATPTTTTVKKPTAIFTTTVSTPATKITTNKISPSSLTEAPMLPLKISTEMVNKPLAQRPSKSAEKCIEYSVYAEYFPQNNGTKSKEGDSCNKHDNTLGKWTKLDECVVDSHLKMRLQNLCISGSESTTCCTTNITAVNEKKIRDSTPGSLNDKRNKLLEKLKNFEDRIRGGTAAAPSEFPHQVNLGYNCKFFSEMKWLCTGSLISENFVLSAAHCSKTACGPPTLAVLGDVNTHSNIDDGNRQEIEIIEVFDHPEYNNKHYYNDISLYRLAVDVFINKYRRPACLNTMRHIEETEATASGWGQIRQDGGSNSPQLLYAKLSITPQSVCSKFWAKGEVLTKGIDDETMICAGDRTGGRDTCQGDSGGPLQYITGNPMCMFTIIGVTSFGRQCGSGIPNIYTRVSHYIPWIESKVWPE